MSQIDRFFYRQRLFNNEDNNSNDPKLLTVYCFVSIEWLLVAEMTHCVYKLEHASSHQDLVIRFVWLGLSKCFSSLPSDSNWRRVKKSLFWLIAYLSRISFFDAHVQHYLD